MQRTRVIVTIYDDLDLRGGLETEGHEHHKLAFDGHEVEIDLSALHSKELSDFLAPYLEAGHTVKYPPRDQAKNPDGPMAVARRVNKAAKEWAELTGRRVPSRGTGLFRQLVADYAQAQPQEYAALTAPRTGK